jgi:hypothetical protein
MKLKINLSTYFYNDIICELSIDDCMVKVLDCGWASEGSNHLLSYDHDLHDLKQSLWCGKYY